ncbi:MAG: GNAT family N-acetyltransferase [Calditrichaeota bacterium]|nr:GNAT family N-acetyltransferase [Calditrichota bacterium]
MIETERLLLKPLNYQQLLNYLKNDNSLERELQLNKSNRIISADLKEAFEQTILPAVADSSKNYLFSTLWTAIYKAENKIIGDLCIVGEPNENGEIEIGYGTYDEFRNMGFMTEIVSGIIRWASTQKNVKAVIASTDKNNVASYSVLKKNHFVLSGENDEQFHWRLDLLH